MTYAEKLKKPAWQKRRLEIFNRDKFTCQLCGDTKTELHVHHKSYSGEPWDADDCQLQTLCKHCHATITKIEDLGRGDMAIIRVIKENCSLDCFVISVILSTQKNPLGVFMYFYCETSNEIEFLAPMTDSYIKNISDYMQGLKSVQPSQSPAMTEE